MKRIMKTQVITIFLLSSAWFIPLATLDFGYKKRMQI